MTDTIAPPEPLVAADLARMIVDLDLATLRAEAEEAGLAADHVALAMARRLAAEVLRKTDRPCQSFRCKGDGRLGELDARGRVLVQLEPMRFGGRCAACIASITAGGGGA